MTRANAPLPPEGARPPVAGPRPWALVRTARDAWRVLSVDCRACRHDAGREPQRSACGRTLTCADDPCDPPMGRRLEDYPEAQ